MTDLSPKQLQIIKVLDLNAGWMTRLEMEDGAGQKGYSRALGAPTTGEIAPESLEGRKYVERRNDTPPFEYRLTERGKEMLSRHERNNGAIQLYQAGTGRRPPNRDSSKDRVVGLEEESADDAAIAEIRSDPTLSDTEKEQLVKARRGQGQFRQELISLWKNKCCLTGCDAIEVLKASHMKPWSQSDNHERLDKFNGFLLTPNADILFDQGYISFSDDGVMQVSPRLSDEARNVLLAECRRKIEVFDKNKPYLDFHRSRRFQR